MFIMLSGAVVATGALVTSTEVQAAVVNRIDVKGNVRMDAETVKSFLTITEGESFGPSDIDDSLKALYNTGLFADVSIYQSGSTLFVEVDENSIINQVYFEGNKRIKDDQLSPIIQSQQRGIYSPEMVASDVEQIRSAYARSGRSDATVSSEVIPLANDRVNIVFRVNEGGKTNIGSITFIGNSAFRASRLRDQMSTKATNLMSWLSNDDIYDPDRLSADEERLRRFYFNKGYADFQIISTSAVLDEVENEYNITISLDEGQRYTFGDVQIDSTLSGLDLDLLYNRIDTRPGDVYSAKDIEDSIINLTETVASQGYAFVDVVPRGSRNYDTGTVDVTYLIDQGARVYIERIVIVGNDRTREYVIRREFDVSEGDAFNQVYIQQAKRRLEGLGLFDRVDITTRSGSSPDRVVVVARVIEKASGDFSIGGGYSTDGGALGEIGFTERNFMGRGQLLRLQGSFGEQEESYRLSFTEPYFLGYRLSAGFDVGATSIDADDNRQYGSDRIFATVRFGIPLTENSAVRAFYTFNDSSTDISKSLLDPPNGNRDGIQGNSTSEISAAFAPPFSPTDWTESGFGYSFEVNTIDNRLLPREGLQFEITQTAFGAGGDASYLQTDLQAVSYATLLEDFDVVGMVRGRAGAKAPFDDDGYRAIDNYFSGSNMVRGFQRNGFGPRDPGTGDALGGMYYWNATAEINYPAPFLPESVGLRGAFFADAGILWGVDDESRSAIRNANGFLSSKRGNVDDEAIRASVGASLIWNSPFGPLRFDYAVPIQSESYDEEQQFNFGVSSQF
jgi:outer membrane protein insertion porin family